MRDLGEFIAETQSTPLWGVPASVDSTPKTSSTSEMEIGTLKKSGPEKGVFWKRGLFRKVHFLEMLEIQENLQTAENKVDSDQSLEILENLESLERFQRFLQ